MKPSVVLFAIGLSSLSAVWSGCSSDTDEVQFDDACDLQARASIIQVSDMGRSLVFGTSFPANQSIGVSLYREDGSDYIGTSSNYVNVAYTSSGTGDQQRWEGASEMMIKAPAKAVAYYPYDPKNAGLTIPVSTADQVDYMYSEWVTGVTSSNPAAAFSMKHALAAIRIRLTRGTYDPDRPCLVTSVGAYSQAFGTSASLNISTGDLSNVDGIMEASEKQTSFQLENPSDDQPGTPQDVDLTVIPVKGVTANALARIIVDGVTFTAPITMNTPFEAGKLYTIELTANNTFLGVGTVYVSPWAVTNVNGNVVEQ